MAFIVKSIMAALAFIISEIATHGELDLRLNSMIRFFFYAYETRLSAPKRGIISGARINVHHRRAIRDCRFPPRVNLSVVAARAEKLSEKISKTDFSPLLNSSCGDDVSCR